MAKYYCTGLGKVPKPMNSCCKMHDQDYGVNGKVTRAEADKKLRLCLRKDNNALICWSFWLACRLFGWLFWKKKAAQEA